MYILEMKNSFPRLISKLDTTQERISELEYRLIEMIQTQLQREINRGVKRIHLRAIGQ